MKVLAHIPVEQYGFIEQELEGSTNEEIKMAYNAIKRVWEHDMSLVDEVRVYLQKDTTYNRFLDHMLTGEPNHVDELEGANDIQKIVINEVKKCLNRVGDKV